MKRLSGLLILLLAGMQLVGNVYLAPATSAQEEVARYIVVLRDDLVTAASEEEIAEDELGRPADYYYSSAIQGFAAPMTQSEVVDLEANPAVAYVVRDRPVYATGQTIATGISRIEDSPASKNSTAHIDGVDQRVNVDVAVIDSGIQADHPDLNVQPGTNCTFYSGTDDANGHGTHVAGIIGAIDNDIGTVGVAPGARLYPVRVLGPSGSGTTAGVICGIDWVTANAATIDVANMSLTSTLEDGEIGDDGHCGNTNNDPEHQAICAAVAAGVTFVVAAGNSTADASGYLPAAYHEVITVSALNDIDGMPGGYGGSNSRGNDDEIANFSNYGAAVDIAAPGVNILSTYKGSSYATISGTSMASPHVAGAAALAIASGAASGPASVQAYLIANRETVAGIAEGVLNVNDGAAWPVIPTPTATVTKTPTITSTPTRTATATATASATNTATATFTPTNTATATFTQTASLTPSITSSPTPTKTSTLTSTSTYTPTITLTPSITSSPTATFTLTPSSTPTRTFTPTNTATVTNTPTVTNTLVNTATNTATFTNTPSPTATQTFSATPSLTASATNTAANTATQTYTPTSTASKTFTVTPSVTNTSSNTPSSTASNTVTSSPTWTPTRTPSPTNTATATFTPSRTATATPTRTPTRTRTPTATRTVTAGPLACSLSPTSGSYGTNVKVTCTGYRNNETVRVYLDSTSGTQLTSFVASNNGGGLASFTIPSGKKGAHSIIVRGVTSLRSITKTLTINPSISLSPTSGGTGSTVSVTLRGFAASESGISIRFYNFADTGYWTVKTGLKASTTGSLTTTFIVPSGSGGGAHKVEARGGSGSIASRTFNVTTSSAAALPAKAPTKTSTAIPPTSTAVPQTPTVTSSATVLPATATLTEPPGSPVTGEEIESNPQQTPTALPTSEPEATPYPVARISRTTNSEPGTLLVDGDPLTVWQTTDEGASPRFASFTLDFDQPVAVGTLRILVGDQGLSGSIRLEVSADDQNWTFVDLTDVDLTAGWHHIAVNQTAQFVRFTFINLTGAAWLGGVAEVEAWP